MQTQTGTAASLLELLSTFPSLRTRGLLRQILGVSERTLKAQVAKDPGATLTLEQGRPVSYRLRECNAKPVFPGNPGFLHPNYDTMLFSMDGGERSVFSRVVKTALDRPDDSGATADIRASDRAKLTARRLVTAQITQKSA